MKKGKKKLLQVLWTIGTSVYMRRPEHMHNVEMDSTISNQKHLDGHNDMW